MDEKKLELFYSSPAEYEKLTLEVQYGWERIAEINQEKGINNLEVELFGSSHQHNFVAKIPLDDLIAILIEAREALTGRE